MNNSNIILIDNNENKKINIFNELKKELIIDIKDNASIVVNYFSHIKDLKSNINIKIGKNSSIIFNHAYINENNYELNIKIEYLNESSNVMVRINGLNDNGLSIVNIDGTLKENNNNNVLDEKIKLLNINNGKSISRPNMFIKTSKIIANHENTIGNINKDEIFYLMSKGLNLNSAKELICTGFLVDIIEDQSIKEEIKEYLNGR